jgi:hypothetical protein
MSASEETEAKGVVTVLLTSGLLILIGIATLCVLMYFSWQFGWSLGKTWWDSLAMGALHVSAEVASAGLVAWSAVIAALGGWAWRRRSLVAFVCAIVFALVSVLNTYGFMSPRIAAVAGHQGVVEAQKSNAEWLKQMSVNPEVADAVGAAAAACANGRGRRCLAAEAKAKFLASQQGHMGEKLEQQFSKLEKSASENPDSHALAVASLTGMSVAAAQKLIIVLMAGFGQCVKFSCTFFGFKGLAAFLHRRRRSLSSSPKGGSGEGGASEKSSDASTDKLPANVTPLRPEVAQLQATTGNSPVVAPPLTVRRVQSDAPRPSLPLTLQPYTSVEDFLARHPSVTSQKVIADAMGVSQAKVSRDIKRLKGRGKVKVEKTWRSNAVAFTPRRNGGLHAVI